MSDPRETSFYVDPTKRSIVLPGLAADKFYSLAVRGYRRVDADIDASGVIFSELTRAKSWRYQPSTTVAFSGDITGTIQGVSTTQVIADIKGMTDDGVLSRVEKQQTVLLWSNIHSQWETASSKANQLGGLDSFVASTGAAITALDTMLNQLAPAWNDLGKDTPVDPQTFQTAFATAQATLADLIAMTVDRASQLASWSGVKDDNGKKPEDNATVGAPAGTYVGDKKAEDLIRDFNQTNKDVRDLVLTFGSSQNAAAAAAAAEAAKNAAQTAETNANKAFSDAQGAFNLADGAAARALDSAAAAAAAAKTSSDAKEVVTAAVVDAQGTVTAAANAKKDALDAASAAAQSKVDAGGFATTARGHAETADRRATAAGQSAETASADAEVARTKAGEASVSEGRASKSAADADGFRNQAATFQEATASTFASALKLVGNSDFSNGLNGWQSSNGSPALGDVAPVNGTSAAYISNLGVTNEIFSAKTIPVSPDRKYRMRARIAAIGPTNGDIQTTQIAVYVGFVGLDANGGIVDHGSYGSYRYSATTGEVRLLPGDGWQTKEVVITGSGNDSWLKFPPGTVQVRPMAILNYQFLRPNGQVIPATLSRGLVDFIEFDDVTETELAKGSAAAAAESASTAAASKKGSEESASASARSEQNASTSASNARASEQNAARSEQNANGASSSASTQAQLAVTARDAARTAAAATVPDNFVDATNWVDWRNWGGGVQFAGDRAITLMGGSVYSLFTIPIAAGRTYRTTMRHRVINQGGGSWYIGTLSYGGESNGVLQWGNSGSSSAIGVWRTDHAEITGDAILASNPGATHLRVCALIGYAGLSDGEITLLRIEDVTSEKQAGESAAASVTNASNAAASKKGAEDAAKASSNSATDASTAAGNAKTYQDNASQSERNAAGSASTAEARAGVASTASRTAIAVASSQLPAAFEQKDVFWSNLYSGADDRVSGFDPVYYAFENGSIRFQNTNGAVAVGNQIDIAHRGSIKLVPGRILRLTAVWRILDSSGRNSARATIYAIGMNGNRDANYTPGLGIEIAGGQPGWGAGAATKYATMTYDVATDRMIANGAVYFRGLFRYYNDGSGDVMELASLSCEDVTSLVKAQDSASAAAGSSSTANTRANDAGDFASAAEASASRANTKAGEASTSASQASDSARDANGAKVAAATSQSAAASTYQKMIEVDGNGNFDQGFDGWTVTDGNPMMAVPSYDGRKNTVRTTAVAPGFTYQMTVMQGPRYNIRDASQRFRLSSGFRVSGGGADPMAWYVGLAFFDANDNLVVGTDGTGNYPLSGGELRFSANQGWIDRKVIVGKGLTSTPEGYTFYGGTVSIPGNAAYFRPLIYINYNRGSTPAFLNAPADVDYFTVEDVTAEINAGQFASASSKSASAASASEGASGRSASAASGSADTANTKAGEALVSARNAATSEENARGFSSTASTASQVAVDSKNAARAQASATFPDSMVSGEAFFMDLAGAPSNTNPLPPNWTFLDDDPWGRLLRITDPGQFQQLRTRGLIGSVANTGRRFRLEARVRMKNSPQTGNGLIAVLTAYGLGADYTTVFYSGYTANLATGYQATTLTLAAGWQTIWIEFDVAANAPCPWIAPSAYIYDPTSASMYGAQIEYQYFKVVDITERTLSAGSASAAAKSASTAEQKATDAGREASAANQSKVDAQAANAGAKGQAEAAERSAATASSQASAATTQKNLAAAYANTAGVTPNGRFASPDRWDVSGGIYGTWYNGVGFRTNGGVSGSIYHQDYLPVDVTRKYRMTFAFVVHTTSCVMYAGFQCFDQNKNSLGNIYMPNVVTEVGGTVATRTYDFTGIAATSIPTYARTNGFIAGTKFVKPLALMNYPEPNPTGAVVDVTQLYLEDVTSELNAAASAGIADSAASTASAQAAAAQRSAVLSASLSGGSLNKNSVFADFPPIGSSDGMGLPPSWNSWTGLGYRTYGNGDLGTDGPSIEGSPWGFHQNTRGGNNEAGIYQDVPGGPGFFAVNATVQVRAGAGFSGAGVLVYGLDGNGNAISSAVINFAADPDIAGTVWGRGVGAGTTTFKWSKVIAISNNNVRTIRIYAMTNWPGFDGTTAEKSLSWLRCSFRVASDAEAKAGKVDDLTARMMTVEGVAARADGRTAAYFEKRASVPGAQAAVVMKAVNDNGVATSDVALIAGKVALQSITGEVVKGGLTVQGSDTIIDGMLTATTGIKVGSGKLKVAIAPTDYAVSNDESVTFGFTFDRPPSITFGPCPVALGQSEVYRAYADVSTTGFVAHLVVDTAPQSTAQSTGAFINMGGAVFEADASGKPKAANGEYTIPVSVYITNRAYAANELQ